jgi:hypothetical protein
VSSLHDAVNSSDIASRYLIHSNSSFNSADSPFLAAWIDVLRPSYDIPSAWTLAGYILDAEHSRVHLLEVNKLQNTRVKTLLWDGWEDKTRHSLYGAVAAGMQEHPVVLGLQNMTGRRGSADELMNGILECLKKMEVEDAKCFIALTTDNPTVMRAFCKNFQTKFPWILTFACFLHSLNTIVGKIVTYPKAKKTILNTNKVTTFFNSSHYWGGQEAEEAKERWKVTRKLKTHTES